MQFKPEHIYTLEQVPKRFREKVRKLVELAEIGVSEEKQETEG